MSNYFDFTFFTLRFDLQTKLFLRTHGDIRNANIDRKIALSLFSHKTNKNFTSHSAIFDTYDKQLTNICCKCYIAVLIKNLDINMHIAVKDNDKITRKFKHLSLMNVS